MEFFKSIHRFWPMNNPAVNYNTRHSPRYMPYTWCMDHGGKQNTRFVEVMPLKARGASQLTYHTSAAVVSGQIVRIPLGRQYTFGIILRQVPPPPFPTRTLDKILPLPPLPPFSLQTIKWMVRHYGADASDVLRLFLPPRPDISSPLHSENIRRQISVPRYKLTGEQQTALEMIIGSKHRQWLLHGVTGSGKTAVYIALCQQLLSGGKSAIVLVPEIVLATQLITEFKQIIGPRVIVTHSLMSASHRRAAWLYALTSDKPRVVIGPRSALFTPLRNLGGIIIDECHETSYKHEQSPYYHARDVAGYIINHVDGKLISGSATPSVHDIFLQKKGRLRPISLPSSIHSNIREVTVVDMKSQKSIFSSQLENALQETMNAKKQALLFINRRGSASQVLCTVCGWVARCPNCNIPQTWHGSTGVLRCHWCGACNKLPGQCPGCHSLSWRFLGIGTQRIEAEIRSRFPYARVLRLDRDTLSANNLEGTMEKLKAGSIDILVGTQMIAKGLDLPNVNLVGVVLADTMLHIPDIGSNERTYQLLHQVIGRAGRSRNLPSKAIIQTYRPEHHAITAAARQDFDGFIATELADREALGYPPYQYLLKLTCKRKTGSGAETAAERLAEHLRHTYSDITVRGPAPAWREKLNQYFYWHLIITARKRQVLTNIMTSLPAGWRADIDPIDLL